MSLELITTFGAAATATAVAAVLSRLMRPIFLEQKDRREKARSKLKEQIQKKIQSGIPLEAKEIADIGRGFELPPSQSITVLNQLYAEAEEKEDHEIYKKLLAEINRAEPFEALPEEVRPSLARLSSLCSESQQESDKELLHPITKVMGEYQEMKSDHASIKKQSRISYIVALVSFFVGVVGLILAFSGPSKRFIAGELEKATSQIEKKIESAQPSAQPGR